MMINARTAYTLAYRQIRCKTYEYHRVPRYETYFYRAAESSWRAVLSGRIAAGCQSDREYFQDRRDETLGIVWAQCHGCPLYHRGHPTCNPHCQILELGDSLLPDFYRRTPRPWGRKLE